MFGFLITRKTLNAMVASLTSEVQQLNNDLTALRSLYAEIQESQATTLEMLKDIVASEVNERVKTIEQERADRVSSTTPYFEVITEIDTDDDSRTKFELDWNPAFIAELRKKGYVGKTENDLVHQWIRTIANHVEHGVNQQNP